MNCKLCGKDLYEVITFYNIFKWNYELHYECEQELLKSRDLAVVPVLDKLVTYDTICQIGYGESDLDYLFTKYIGNKLYKHLNNDCWSIVLLLDEISDMNDLYLAIELGEERVLMISYFEEQILNQE